MDKEFDLALPRVRYMLWFRYKVLHLRSGFSGEERVEIRLQ